VVAKVVERPAFSPPGPGDNFERWAASHISQLLQIFQQYGYRLNRAPTAEEVDADVWNFENMLQVGGDPIVQREINADGTAVWFADGTQFCTTDYTRATTSATSDVPWTYPRPFAASPMVIPGVHRSSVDSVSGRAHMKGSITTTACTIRVIHDSNFALRAFATAFGRWK
jgi:hypothetical protein